ncbi:hypothetical protein GGGNBK_11810 [Sporosarcina sp. ANT_H38]
MAYTIINSFIPATLYPLKAPYPMIPEYITIHNSYNDATAANEIAYMTRNTNPVSYHVAIDDKKLYKQSLLHVTLFMRGMVWVKVIGHPSESKSVIRNQEVLNMYLQKKILLNMWLIYSINMAGESIV